MFKKLLSCLLLITFILLICGGLVAWQSYRFWLQSPGSDAMTISGIVENGTGFSTLAQSLEEQGVIKSAFWFRIYALIDGTARKVEAGSYNVTPGMSYSALIDVLTNATSEEVSFTIPEGYNVRQIGEVVTKTLGIATEDWNVMIGPNSPLSDHPLLVRAKKPTDVDMEGYLFPDTYRVFPDATAEDVVMLMLNTMDQRLTSNNIAVEGGDPDVTSLHQIITIASILEREVRHKSDLPTVSGIIYNRLNIGMSLQMDSTVNYITGKDTPSISLADRDIMSPYNTYQNAGLPPGPISNPGIDAIRAAVNPEANDYLFFLTTEDGTAVYANTHDQHVANKNRYLP